MSSPVVVMLLRPCPHVSGYFWKLKKIHIHTKCIQIIFAYPHEKAVKNNGNMIDDVFMVYDSHHCIRKPLFSSVHLQTKGWCFQRFQPWRVFLKRCVFGDRIRVDSRPNRRKSNVFFQTKWMRVDRAYYYFLCELPDIIKLCQTTRRCVRRRRPVRNEAPVIHG